MRLSIILRSLKNVTEGMIEIKAKRNKRGMNVFLERLPKKKPYWLTKSNTEIPRKSRAIVDIIQTYKARVNEPGFLKRGILARNYLRQNE